jgi:hypothetical protein
MIDESEALDNNSTLAMSEFSLDPELGLDVWEDSEMPEIVAPEMLRQSKYHRQMTLKSAAAVKYILARLVSTCRMIRYSLCHCISGCCSIGMAGNQLIGKEHYHNYV